MLSYLLNGFSGPAGPFMYALLAVMAFAIAVTVERTITILRARADPEASLAAALSGGTLGETPLESVLTASCAEPDPLTVLGVSEADPTAAGKPVTDSDTGAANPLSFATLTEYVVAAPADEDLAGHLAVNASPGAILVGAGEALHHREQALVHGRAVQHDRDAQRAALQHLRGQFEARVHGRVAPRKAHVAGRGQPHRLGAGMPAVPDDAERPSLLFPVALGPARLHCSLCVMLSEQQNYAAFC